MKFYIRKIVLYKFWNNFLFKSMLAKVTYFTLTNFFNIKNDKKLSLYTTISGTLLIANSKVIVPDTAIA